MLLLYHGSVEWNRDRLRVVKLSQNQMLFIPGIRSPHDRLEFLPRELIFYVIGVGVVRSAKGLGKVVVSL